MSTLHIQLFGRFGVTCDGQALAGIEAGKVQELFCYLLLFRRQRHPREKLAGLLWAENPTAQAKKYLRQALWQLQSVLDARTEPAETPPVLLVEPDWVTLNPQAAVDLDVATFEGALGPVRGIADADLEGGSIRALEQAAALYGGDLLEGWYQDWCLYERERLQSLYLTLLDKLMGACLAHGEYEAGIAHGQDILRFDRARERTHRRLMRLYYLAGDRTSALRQYIYCASALQEELGVRPARSTEQLVEQIRADRLEPSPSPPPIRAGNATPDPLPDLLARLVQMRDALADVQRQVQREIQTVQQALRSQASK